jgi:hypothetical protein
VLRFLFWRALALLSICIALTMLNWLLGGGAGRALRGRGGPRVDVRSIFAGVWGLVSRAPAAIPGSLTRTALIVLVLAGLVLLGIAVLRVHARRRRSYVRLEIEAYRTDHAEAEALVTMFSALHAALIGRWWRRALSGQPSLGLEVHHSPGVDGAREPARTWLALTCLSRSQRTIEAALRVAYPNIQLRVGRTQVGTPPALLRLKKHTEFVNRMHTPGRLDAGSEPPMNRLMTTMGACAAPAFVQIALTPTPASFEAFARHLYKRRESRLARRRSEGVTVRERSLVEEAELRGGLEVQHRPLFFVDLRVIAPNRSVCEQISSALRTDRAENRFVERGTAIRHGAFNLYAKRVVRGEGNPVPDCRRGVLASSELAELWQLPSVGYSTVPFARAALPLAPAPPAIHRPPEGWGTLRDAHGPVSIHVEMRKQNTAVPGTVEQGKSSYLVASVAEDLRRERCAVIVLDPKGDAAEAALSAVPVDRTCTLLDFASPTCGFNPLAVDAPADVIADYVVGALKSLFTDADIRASSDRYLRNAIIAVLAHNPNGTLWDAARLLSVGEEGYAYRRMVGAKVRALPELREISQFFTAELSAQLADSRSTTTSKLDAPVNKLARLLNSPSIKRVLLNDSLRVDFDRVISGGEVLVVKGALGGMGAGNTAVLMQLLVGMLDAALARQQDMVPAERRVAVALKVDEAPLVLNRGFAETMALKRSAGLETVACWQTDSQWVEREVRDQLDALFAHRVYFATASAKDARAAVALTMAEFSDTVRSNTAHLSSLGRPDVRLRLPRHHAVVSWTTPQGRQAAFIAKTIEMNIDRERLALHAAAQHARGGRPMIEFDQPHWDAPNSHEGHRAPRAPVSTSIPNHEPDGRESVPVPLSPLPDAPAESYRELVELDLAHRARPVASPRHRAHLEPEDLDIEILTLIASMGQLLTSQIHRHFNPTKAASTTQRRLKRLSDAGLVDRIQFHRRDGGGVPMCCAISRDGMWLLEARGRGSALSEDARPSDLGDGDSLDTRRLDVARRQLHAAGWALAWMSLVSSRSVAHGSAGSVLHPPKVQGGSRALGPTDLRLPSGRVPHDFLRTGDSGKRVEVERFETIRPDGRVLLPSADQSPATEILLDLDDRAGRGGWIGKLERYDHFLSGWAAHTRRYGPRGEASPLVVFVCRDRARARSCAIEADSVLGACRAYAGEYPQAWQYPGREQVLFVGERDIHEGLRQAYGVPRLPPSVRVGETHGDPRAGEAIAVVREIEIVRSIS